MSDNPNTRDSLRTAILSNVKSKFKSKPVRFHGVDIDVRQPSLEEVLSLTDDNNPDESRTTRIIKGMVRQCFVPGTEEKVFEEGDIPVLASMPFDSNFKRLSDVMDELSSIDVEEQEKNSETALNDIMS